MLRRSLCKVAPALPLLLLGASAQADIYSENFNLESSISGHWSNTSTSSLINPFGNFLGRFGSETVRLQLYSEETGGAGTPAAGGGDSKVNPFGNVDSVLGNTTSSRSTPNQQPPNGSRTIPTIITGVFDFADNNEEPADEDVYHAGSYTLSFDLYLFDSWDGGYLPHGPDSIAVEINGVEMFHELFDVHDQTRNFRLPDETPGASAVNSRWEDMIYRDITIEFTTSEVMDSFIIDFIGTTSEDLSDESWGLDNVRIFANSRASDVPTPSGLALLGLATGGLCRRRRVNRAK